MVETSQLHGCAPAVFIKLNFKVFKGILTSESVLMIKNSLALTPAVFFKTSWHQGHSKSVLIDIYHSVFPPAVFNHHNYTAF